MGTPKTTDVSDSSDTSDESLVKILSLFFLSLATLPLSIVLNGILLRTLWLWFVVPLGIPAIGGAHAMGLAAMVTLGVVPSPTIKRQTETVDKTKEKSLGRFLAESYAVLIMRFGMTYLLCWLYHGRMVS